MKWRGSSCLTLVVGLALFVVFGITASAQPPQMVLEGAKGIAELGAAAYAAWRISQPVPRYEGPQQMAARRAAYNAKTPATVVPNTTPAFNPGTHAVEKHPEANVAWVQAHTDPDRGGPCKEDGRVRYAKKLPGGKAAFSVEEADGSPVTAFIAESWEYANDALTRDGCVDEMKRPTLNVGHDNMHPQQYTRIIVPSQTNQAGPVKSGTPTAMELAQARRASQGGGAR